MRLLMIASLVDDTGTIVGYRFINPDEDVQKDAAGVKKYAIFAAVVEKVVAFIKSGAAQFVNLAISKSGELKGIGGDIGRYTAINANTCRAVTQQALVIIRRVENGFLVCTSDGVQKRVQTETLVKFGHIANGKVVQKGDVKTVSAIQGEYEMEVPKRAVTPAQGILSPEPVPGVPDPGVVVENAVELKPPKTFEAAPSPFQMSEEYFSMNYRFSADDESIANLAEIADATCPGRTVEDKMKRLMFSLRSWSPLYFTILSTLQRVVTTRVETMGVNLKEWVFNPLFISTTPEDELMFILCHEVGHIIYGHTIRRGDRDPELWNVAADLIVNASLVKEFGLAGIDATVSVDGAPPNLISKCTFKGGLFSAMVDPDSTNVEELYQKLEDAQAESSQQKSVKASEDYKAGRNAGLSISNNVQAVLSGKSESYRSGYAEGISQAYDDIVAGSKATLPKAGNADFKSGFRAAYAAVQQAFDRSRYAKSKVTAQMTFISGSASGVLCSLSEASKPDNDYLRGFLDGLLSNPNAPGSTGQGQGQGNAEDYEGALGASGQSQGGSGQQSQGNSSQQQGSSGQQDRSGQSQFGNNVPVNIPGYAQGTMSMDIDETNGDSSADGKDNVCGGDPNRLAREREMQLKELLRRSIQISSKTRSECSIGAAAKRYIQTALAPEINWQAYLEKLLIKGRETITTYASPDRRFLWQSEVLPGQKVIEDTIDLVVAIDTSGSISDADLGIAAGHIMQIAKRYRINGWVCYWDTSCGGLQKLRSKADIRRMEPVGGGGTDVNCFLDWLVKQEHNRRNPLHPCAVIIITDGYINSNDQIRRMRDSRRFIWIINSEAYSSFTPPFGVKARLKK